MRSWVLLIFLPAPLATFTDYPDGSVRLLMDLSNVSGPSYYYVRN